MLELYRHDEPYYPSSDNEPMGENDVICWLMTSALDMLKRHFQDDENVYVSSNSFVYYVKDDPTQRVAPDLYVVKGVSSAQRPNYKIWEEGVVPQVVFEFTTESSRYKDLGLKKGLYEALGVKEYYLFDPAGEYLTPSFRAFKLVDGVLVEREHRGSHFSEELNLTIKPAGKLLRFFPPRFASPRTDLSRTGGAGRRAVRSRRTRSGSRRTRSGSRRARSGSRGRTSTPNRRVDRRA